MSRCLRSLAAIAFEDGQKDIVSPSLTVGRPRGGDQVAEGLTGSAIESIFPAVDAHDNGFVNFQPSLQNGSSLALGRTDG